MSFLSFNIALILQTRLLPALSNIFMTFAMYARFKDLSKDPSAQPCYPAAFASWGIALFECLPQVPANRIGHT